MAMIKKIGLPRSDDFLYGEDLEYSLRMKENGYVCFWVPDSKCPEKRQAKMEISFFGRRSRIHKDAFRHYYAFCNEICILSEYGEWTKLLLALLYGLKVYVALSFSRVDNKRGILDAIRRGIIHGVRRRTGINPEYIPIVAVE